MIPFSILLSFRISVQSVQVTLYLRLNKFHVNVLSLFISASSALHQPSNIRSYMFLCLCMYMTLTRWRSEANRNDEKKDTKSKRIHWKKMEKGKIVRVFRFPSIFVRKIQKVGNKSFSCTTLWKMWHLANEYQTHTHTG